LVSQNEAEAIVMKKRSINGQLRRAFWISIKEGVVTINSISQLVKELEQEYRSLNEKIKCNIKLNDLEIDIAGGNLILVTEGERKIGPYEVISSEDKMFQSGLGYVMEETRNNQKVQKGDACWRKLLASLVRKEDLEAEATTDFVFRVLTEMNLAELSSMLDFELDGVMMASIYSEGRIL
jgi:hypothetical protein